MTEPQSRSAYPKTYERNIVVLDLNKDPDPYGLHGLSWEHRMQTMQLTITTCKTDSTGSSITTR